MKDSDLARLESIERMLDAGMFPPKAMMSLVWLVQLVRRLDARLTASQEAVEDLAEHSPGER